jgi:hypothetical protein
MTSGNINDAVLALEGAWFFITVIGAPFTFLVSALLLWFYRRAVLRGMKRSLKGVLFALQRLELSILKRKAIIGHLDSFVHPSNAKRLLSVHSSCVAGSNSSHWRLSSGCLPVTTTFGVALIFSPMRV